MANNSDFTHITNGIDDNIEIIQHIDTGFYNITSISKYITKLSNYNKCSNIHKFFKLDTTIDIIDECKKYTKLNDVYYTLSKGIPKIYTGTYVHRLLYDHFLIWLDARYAIKISIILDNIHKEANKKLIHDHNTILAEMRQHAEEARKREEKLDKQAEEAKQRDIEQKELLNKYSEEAKQRDIETQKIINKQSNKIKTISKKATNIQTNLLEARSEIQDLNVKNDKIKDLIVERADNHATNPKSEAKLEYFVCLQNPKKDNELYVARTQKYNMNNIINNKKPTWKIVIEKTKDPNAVKMYNRFKELVVEYNMNIKKKLKTKLKNKLITDAEYNIKLQEILNNPTISVSGNNITFNKDKLRLEQVVNTIKNVSNDRFRFEIPE